MQDHYVLKLTAEEAGFLGFIAAFGGAVAAAHASGNSEDVPMLNAAYELALTAMRTNKALLTAFAKISPRVRGMVAELPRFGDTLLLDGGVKAEVQREEQTDAPAA